MLPILNKAKEKFLEYELDKNQYIIFFWLGIFHSFIPSTILGFRVSLDNNVIIISLLSLIFCFYICFRHEGPKLSSIYSALLWYLGVFICFPLQGSLMFVTHIKNVEWAMYLASSFIILAALVNAYMYTLLTLISVVCSILYRFLVLSRVEILDKEFISYIYFFVITIFLSLLWHIKMEINREEKERIGFNIAGYIAHETRNVFAFFVAIASGLEELILKEQIKILGNDQKREYFTNIPKDIKLMCRKENFFIDMLLTKLKPIEILDKEEFFDISELIHEALKEYSIYKDIKYVKVSIKKSFYIKGNEIAMRHVIFNLLNNAITATKHTKHPKVQIITTGKGKFNILKIKDNGKGINSSEIKKVFDYYYTKSINGVGIGLSFCKDTLNGMKGKVECYSKEGKYAEFILYFPIVKKGKTK